MWSTLKYKFGRVVFYTGFFLAPVKASLWTALGLVFLDLIFGVWAACKRQEPITSLRLRSTIAKLGAYETAIVLAFVVEKYLAGGIPFAHIVGGFIGATELKSVYENLQAITGTDLAALVTRVQGTVNTTIPSILPPTPPKVDPPNGPTV